MEHGSGPRAWAILGTCTVALATAVGCTDPAALFGDGYFDVEELMRAKPDECFVDIGQPAPPGPPCPPGSVEKVNEAYVWGLTEEDGSYVFGTAPNVLCLVEGGFLGNSTPQLVPSWVCEFGQSQVAQLFGLPDAIGDWRPPSAFLFDSNTQTGQELTPPDPRFTLTLGIRSAGSLDGVAILAGPALSQAGGLNFFAWHVATKQYLGSAVFADYTNIRSWVEHEGVLYTAVEHSDGSGRVLRWAGTQGDPFQFDEIATLEGDPANLSIYEAASGGKHLAITTWPGFGGGVFSSAALYVSPEIPPGGLTAAQGAGYKRQWQYSDYEPDAVVAAVTGGGAAAYFDGWHWWGTMHVPLLAGTAYALGALPGGPLDPNSGPEEVLETILNTWRAVSIFRGRNLETDNPEIQLVYGEEELMAWNFAAQEWQVTPNNMGTVPVFGSSGFGNDYNNYLWVAGESFGNLVMGTMDNSYLVDSLVLTATGEDIVGQQFVSLFQQILVWLDPTLEGQLDDLPSPLLATLRGHGADLWRFDSADSPASPAITNGANNPLAYGFRSIISKDDLLVLGTANPMNLETDGPLWLGGWQLLNLTP